MKDENIKYDELLTVINEGFSDIRLDIKEFKDGALTKAEKEEVLDMVRHYNHQLEDNALGKKNIALSRDEYDGVSKAVGFKNRFA